MSNIVEKQILQELVKSGLQVNPDDETLQKVVNAGFLAGFNLGYKHQKEQQEGFVKVIINKLDKLQEKFDSLLKE